MEDCHFGHADPDLFKEGTDQPHFVHENKAHVLYAWIVLDQKELLVPFIQVLSSLVSIDSSSEQPLCTGTAHVHWKRKSNEEDDSSQGVLRDIRKDLKASFQSINARVSADHARANASIFTGCVTVYNQALESSNQNKSKIADSKLCLLDRRA